MNGYIKIIPKTDVELSDEQVQRNDNVDSSVFECITTLAEKDIEWDMEVIGETTDAIKEVLSDHGIRVRHPGVSILPGDIMIVTEYD
jgi:hypothetical protein